MQNSEANLVIELYSESDIDGLNPQSVARLLAYRFNVTMNQVIQNAGEYQKLIQDAHKYGWSIEQVRKNIFGSNRFLNSTHALFLTERDFGKKSL